MPTATVLPMATTPEAVGIDSTKMEALFARAKRDVESELWPQSASARNEPPASHFQLRHGTDDERCRFDTRRASGKLSLAVRRGRADRRDRRMVVLARHRSR